MSWGDLRVIAGRAPEPLGVAFCPPVAEDQEKRCFLLRDVSAESPRANAWIHADEFKRMIELGTWVRVPYWPARRDYLLVLVSRELEQVIFRVNQHLLPCTRLESGFASAYVALDHARRWAGGIVSSILDYAQARLGEILKTPGKEATNLDPVEEALRAVRFLSERGSSDRSRMYVLLGLLLMERQPSRWAVVKDLALRELSRQSLDGPTLEDQIGRLRQDLMGKKGDHDVKTTSPGPRRNKGPWHADMGPARDAA